MKCVDSASGDKSEGVRQETWTAGWGGQKNSRGKLPRITSDYFADALTI